MKPDNDMGLHLAEQERRRRFGLRDSEDPATAAPVSEDPDPSGIRAIGETDPQRLLDPASAAPEPRPVTPLAQQLFDTAAPAVGVISLDMSRATELQTAIDGFAGTGVFEGTSGRYAPRAAVFSVSHDSNGRYLATTIQPGRSTKFTAPEIFTPHPGPGSEAEVLRWLEAQVTGLRGAVDVGGLPLLVLIDAGCFEDTTAVRDRLANLARDANATVVIVRHQPGLEKAVYKAKSLPPSEPADPPAVPLPPARAASLGKPPETAGLAPSWFKTARELVRTRPEAITTPSGDQISVSYGHQDGDGTYVQLRGHREVGGRLRPIDVVVAPGVKVPLESCHVYV